MDRDGLLTNVIDEDFGNLPGGISREVLAQCSVATLRAYIQAGAMPSSGHGPLLNSPCESTKASGTPPPPPPGDRLKRVRVESSVQAAKIVNQPQPVYPSLARQVHVTGNVVLHAIIHEDGRVGELAVVSGHPLLVQAALEAVRQWRYVPTLLNGEPVEVDTTISVPFALDEKP